MRISPLVLTCLLTAIPAARLMGQEFEFWPGTEYDSTVPTLSEVLGHAPGERITTIAEIHTYFAALAAAAPDRMKLQPYARSWEGRDLIYVVLGSPGNIARLSEIQDGMKALADPRTTSVSEAQQLIGSLPAITWLAYGVHGNEISSPDAAMMAAYHLLAAQGDSVVDEILAHSLLILDPSQNPDGRDRFTNHFREEVGLFPVGSPWAAERDEPWPGGRTNHYLFDLNRDWFAITQPETLGRIAALQQWYPQVYVDLHEMGSDSTYYFAPSALPVNPYILPSLKQHEELYGKNNAYWFDNFGFDYFNRETYDHFYPGYGDSWPAFQGTVGMTYEQASVRGMIARTTDGRELHFRDSVRHHFVASIATAQTTARNREAFLRAFWDFRSKAVETGRSDQVKALVIAADRDPSAANELASLLKVQGIEVSRNRDATSACGAALGRGSLAISLAQPTYQLIRTLLDRDVAIATDFMEEQEARRLRGQPHQLYDVTAFSLPLLFNLEALPCAAMPAGFSAEPLPALDAPRSDAKVAYLVPWGSLAAARLLTWALSEGLAAVSPDGTFTIGGREYPRGTLVFKTRDNSAGKIANLLEIAHRLGAEIVATDTAYVEAGMSFGSTESMRLRLPRVALAWDQPTNPYSAGNSRWVLEQRYGLAVTPIRTRRLVSADLDRFDVLLLPAGLGYTAALGPAGAERIKQWVKDGGTLIGFEGAVDWLASDKVGLISSQREQRAATDGPPEPLALRDESDYRSAIAPQDRRPDQLPGAILRTEIDDQHWLTAGLPSTLPLLVNGDRIYEPLDLDKGANAVRFAARDTLVASGYVWEENQVQLAFKPVTMVQQHGRGLVIAFTVDPTFRGMQRSTDILLINAIVRGTAHATRLR